jgi:hypothetical protein
VRGDPTGGPSRSVNDDRGVGDAIAMPTGRKASVRRPWCRRRHGWWRLLALPNGRRHAKGASNGEGFAGLKCALWYRVHNEVHVDWIYYCQARL